MPISRHETFINPILLMQKNVDAIQPTGSNSNLSIDIGVCHLFILLTTLFTIFKGTLRVLPFTKMKMHS